MQDNNTEDKLKQMKEQENKNMESYLNRHIGEISTTKLKAELRRRKRGAK